jgi:hypothetical protein
MSLEILLLGVFVGLTLLAYMVAINAHGPVRLGLSYLIATAMLAGTVWAIVQHVNTKINNQKVEEIKRLEMEKDRAEQKAVTQERALIENKGRLAFAAKLNAVITKGTSLSSTMTNLNLQDGSVDLDGLMGRANEMTRQTGDFRQDFEKVRASDTMYTESMNLIGTAAQLLTEAAYYYRSYYHSEDSDQEQVRERMMRQKAREAGDKLQKASSMIAGS